MTDMNESYNTSNWKVVGETSEKIHLDKYDSGFGKSRVLEDSGVREWIEKTSQETLDAIAHREQVERIEQLSSTAPAGQEILSAGLDVVEMLLAKNISYGNSAIEPLRLFSKANNEEQIYVRVDDKLSRLKNNQSYPGDNDIDDLIGYLILLKVARRKNG